MLPLSFWMYFSGDIEHKRTVLQPNISTANIFKTLKLTPERSWWKKRHFRGEMCFWFGVNCLFKSLLEVAAAHKAFLKHNFDKSSKFLNYFSSFELWIASCLWVLNSCTWLTSFWKKKKQQQQKNKPAKSLLHYCFPGILGKSRCLRSTYWIKL